MEKVPPHKLPTRRSTNPRFHGKLMVYDQGKVKSLQEWLQSLPPGGTLRVVKRDE